MCKLLKHDLEFCEIKSVLSSLLFLWAKNQSNNNEITSLCVQPELFWSVHYNAREISLSLNINVYAFNVDKLSKGFRSLNMAIYVTHKIRRQVNFYFFNVNLPKLNKNSK